MTEGMTRRRWRFGGARRILRAANRPALDAWVRREGARISGLVINVGAGEDSTTYGDRTIRVDAFAPDASVRADFSSPLPFRDAAFDGAICAEVLEHVPDADALLQEIRRVLRPGGRLICTVPFVFHFHSDPADFRRFSPPGLARALVRAGFEVEFKAGIGGKVVAGLLFVDSIGLPVRVGLRALMAPLAPLFAARQPRADVWSDYAANAVAIARRPR